MSLSKIAIENRIRKFAPVSARPEVIEFACENWEALADLDLTDYLVKDLAVGVQRSEFPSGSDKGPLTVAIE